MRMISCDCMRGISGTVDFNTAPRMLWTIFSRRTLSGRLCQLRPAETVRSPAAEVCCSSTCLPNRRKDFMLKGGFRSSPAAVLGVCVFEKHGRSFEVPLCWHNVNERQAQWRFHRSGKLVGQLRDQYVLATLTQYCY